MIPIKFEGANTILPYMDMPAYIGALQDGCPFVLMAFQPNKEDLEALQRGEPIYIRTLGPVAVPIEAYTFDENNNVNS